jgi:site-specific recombinase XerD
MPSQRPSCSCSTCYRRCSSASSGNRHRRHTFATHSLRKGVSLLVVKEVLGHSSVSTTERYLHLLRETMTQELEAHPL